MSRARPRPVGWQHHDPEVHVHEVLDQDQLRDMIALARSSEGVFRRPGQAGVERDV
jgi:hypothetical protein